MVTTVSGKHMEVGESLHNYVQQRIAGGVRKQLDHVTQAKITFSKNTYLYHVDIMIHDSNLGLIRATCESEDAYAAFDNALIKIEKQLRRYMSKIKNHHKHIKNHEDSVQGTKYVLNIPKEIVYDDNQITHHHEPVTIAEKLTDIEKLTVSEAIMKMDLAHLPALLFINKTNHRLNVVYHRADGNISWIDPQLK